MFGKIEKVEDYVQELKIDNENLTEALENKKLSSNSRVDKIVTYNHNLKIISRLEKILCN